jgi:C-terminal processing protease CtpA/Prc
MRSLLFVLLMLGPLEASAADTGYAADLEAFFAEVDARYPFFDLKGIRAPWEETKMRLREAVTACEGDSAFLGIVREAMGALRDSHVNFTKTRVEPPPWPVDYYPNLGFMPASEQRACVWWADEEKYPNLKPGMIITQIDGEPAREYLEARGRAAWAEGFTSGPQRARMMAYRIPMRGERGAEHSLTCEVNGLATECKLICDTEARGWAHTYNLPENLTRSGSTFYTALTENIGYVYLRRMDDSVLEGLLKAKLAQPHCRAWIFDLCGNGGGGYDNSLINVVKNWPEPVAGIIDAGCISAGETFARDLRQYAGAKLFGETTAGASSSKYTWAFPSGIATVTLPSRSRWRADGEPIEFNGITPDFLVEANPEDVAAGHNTAIESARQYLEKALEQGKT